MIRLALLLGVMAASAACLAQQAGATGPPLVIRTTSLPKAYVRQPYEAGLKGQGGIAPLHWEVTGGALPAGVILSQEGVLSGTPADTGEFHFIVTMRDSGKPAYEERKQLSLTVVAPLLAQWGRYPKMAGHQIEGSVEVSNQTDHDFDLTVIVLAVDETGRATAIGYQHFTLKKDTAGVEIPFRENLPRGAYQVNVDAVAEVAESNSIYRARLAPGEKFQVQQGP